MTTTTSNLEFVQNSTYRYINGAIEDRWGNPYRAKHALVLTKNGHARLGSIFGYITALASLEETKKFAETLADGICKELDYLNGYGGYIKDDEDLLPGEYPTTRYRIELSDDGTLHGFSIMWYKYVPLDHPKAEERLTRSNLYGRPEYKYAFNFNGALLYHGPAGSETFSVSLDSNSLWSVHT